MPNKVQFEELKNYTTSEWTTTNGVVGRKFINKSDSNKYVFLPASGYWSDATHAGVSTYGNYWSTTWYSSPYVWSVEFTSRYINLSVPNRRFGQSVRAVQ